MIASKADALAEIGRLAQALEALQADNARLKDSAETWHNRYRDSCLELNDKIAVVGAENVALEAENAALREAADEAMKLASRYATEVIALKLPWQRE